MGRCFFPAETSDSESDTDGFRDTYTKSWPIRQWEYGGYEDIAPDDPWDSWSVKTWWRRWNCTSVTMRRRSVKEVWLVTRWMWWRD